MKRMALMVALLAVVGAAAAQQNYPSRPLRMVIPWPPGQATDLVGRIVAHKLTELLNQQMVSDNLTEQKARFSDIIRKGNIRIE